MTFYLARTGAPNGVLLVLAWRIARARRNRRVVCMEYKKNNNNKSTARC